MKKMGKKIISLLLAAMIIFGSVAAGVAEIDFADIFSITAEAATYSGSCGDNLTWNFDTSTGELTISGTGAMWDWDRYSSIPWYSNLISIKTVTIQNGATSIGDLAFQGCDNLTSITIPDSVTSIGSFVFNGCNKLTSITIPDGVTNIDSFVFNGCNGLTSVKIPDSVTSIGESAFSYCRSLTSITFGENSQLTSIGDYAFAVTSLTSIKIPDSVTSIGYCAFSCDSLTSITFGENSQLTSISHGTFMSCDSLTSVDFGKNSQLTRIENSAFDYCPSLTNITIPDSVTSIGNSAFSYCYSLASVDFGKNSQLTSIENSAFNYCSSLTNITIPDSVTSIGESAFSYCTSLTSVDFGKNSQLTSIENSAFKVCPSLTSIEIPDSVTRIGTYAFFDCSSLEYVHIPTSVTTIGINILYNTYNTSAYICSTTEDCYAKTYADANSIEFRVCTNHGNEPVHTHSYTEYRTEPTCQKFGYIFYLCSCGDYYMELLPKVNHSWKLVSIVEATCTEPGYEVYECQYEGCGETKTVEIGAKNHNFPANNAEYVEPTCTEDGYWILRCVACGEEQIKVNPGSKTGHDFGDGEIVKAPSCNEGGVIRYTCSCGYGYDEGVAPAHNAMNDGEVTTEPTCTEPGVITYTCTECGEGYTEEIPALGHTLSYKDNGNGTHTVSCSECRYKENENHTLRGRKCVCGYTDTSVISVLLIQDNAPWLTKSNEKVLAALEAENYIDSWEICRTSVLSEVDLSGYSIVMFANDQGQNAYNNLKKNSEAINAYVEDGGVLIAGACDDGWIDGFLDNSSLPGGLTKSFVLDYNNKIADSDHPIVTGELTDNRELYNNDLYHNYCSHTSFSNIPENANVILTDTNGKATLLEYQYGNGYVIASGLTWEHNMEYHAYSTYYAEKAYEDVIAYAASIAGPADNRYVVRFVDWDGDVLKRERVAYGEAATAPSAPEREGYEFKGWDKEFNAITAHTVVNAVYEIKQYNVTVEFDETKGFATGSGTYDFGSGAALEASAFSGYNFIGWYEGNVLLSTDELYIYAVPARDVTITASFAKDVPTLSGIRVNTMPAKTSYFVGEGFDRDGLTILATYSDGSTAVIENGFTCTPNVFTKIGTQTITVSYGGKTCTFEVEVADVVLESIEINSLPIKTEYTVGETLVTTGLTLLAKYSNGAEKIISSGFTCTPTVLNNAGKQIITVIYEGYVCSFEVTVNEKEEEEIFVYATYIVDGEVYTIYELEPGDVIPIPVNPEKDGWTFNGWTPEIPEKISYDDMTFIAVFTEGAPKFYVNEPLESYEYTGYPIMPAIDVYSTETNEILEEYVDYIINYSNNIDAGVAQVEIVGIGDYEGEVIFSTFIIYARSASNVTVSKIPATHETGSPICVVPIVKDGKFTLVKGVDFDLEYENNVNPGTATVTIIFKGNYSGTKTVTFEILEASDRFIAAIVPDLIIIPYDDFPRIPIPDGMVICNEDNRILIEDEDYVIECPQINGVGMAEIVVKGINDYEGEEFVIVVTVVATDISGIEVNYNETVVYTGNDITLDLEGKVICGNTVLVEGVDYITEYINNRNTGTMTVIIIGIGNYSGRIEFEVEIEKADISGMDVSEISDRYAYTGNEIKPEIVLGNLVLGRDYTVTYTNNVNIGTATVIIKGIGNYTGEIRITFVIIDASTSATSASVSIISDITSLGYEEKATLQTSVVWGDYNWGYLVWTSSNDSVATVNDGGIVKVLDEGTVTITVKLCDINGNIIFDENGNEVSDSIEIKCTMTLWQKIVRWFRILFAALAGIFG